MLNYKRKYCAREVCAFMPNLPTLTETAPLQLAVLLLKNPADDPQSAAWAGRKIHKPARREMMQRWADYVDMLRISGGVFPMSQTVEDAGTTAPVSSSYVSPPIRLH
jgi:hypothetical protein